MLKNKSWKFTLLLVVVSAVFMEGSAFLLSLSSGTHMLDSSQLNSIVGSVEGDCCQPGRRWGCDPAYTPDYPTACATYPDPCSGTYTAPCTNAACVDDAETSECDYSPQTVGGNQCRYVLEDGDCPLVYVGGNTYIQQQRCTIELDTAWNEPGHLVATRNVCDGPTTCAASYSFCEG